MTIKASQDAEAARTAVAEAKVEMQNEVYADARGRVAKLIKDFNTMPMELQTATDGSPTGRRFPLHSSYGCGREYQLLSKGLRFFLLWAKDGRSLVLALNAVCRYASEYTEAKGQSGAAARQLHEKSLELMSLEEADQCLMKHGLITNDTRNYSVMGHITLDGRFARGCTSYDDKENPELVCKTPVEWMTHIVGGYAVAPFVVVGPKKKGKT